MRAFPHGRLLHLYPASAQFSVSLINSGDIVVLRTAHYSRRHSCARQYGDFMEMSVVSRKAALNRSPRMDMYGQTDALPATMRPIHSLKEGQDNLNSSSWKTIAPALCTSAKEQSRRRRHSVLLALRAPSPTTDRDENTPLSREHWGHVL